MASGNKDPEIGLRFGVDGFIASANKAKNAVSSIGNVDLSKLTNKIGSLGSSMTGMTTKLTKGIAGIGKAVASGLGGALAGGGIAGYAGAAGGLAGGIIGSFGGPAVAAAAAAAGAAIATGIGKGIDSSIGAAMNEDRLNDRLKQVFGPQNFDFLDETSNKVKRAFGFDDEEAKDALNIFGQMGMDAQKSAASISLAADVARAKHIGLSDAAKLVGKAYQGNLAAAKKLGLEVEKTGDPLKDQANLLDSIQKKFGGAAAKYAENLPPFAKVQLAMDDLVKSIGHKLVPIVVPFMEWLSGAITSMLDSEGFNSLIDGLVHGFKTGWGYAKQIGMTLATYGIAFFAMLEELPAAISKMWDSGKLMDWLVSMIGGFLKLSWDALLLLGGLVKTGILDGIPALVGFLGKSLLDLLRSVLGETISNKIGLGKASEALGNMMKDSSADMAESAKKSFAAFGARAKEDFGGIADVTKDAFATGGLDMGKNVDDARAKTNSLFGYGSDAKAKMAKDTADLYGQTGKASKTIGISKIGKANATQKNRQKLAKSAAQDNKKNSRGMSLNINLQSSDRLNPLMATA